MILEYLEEAYPQKPLLPKDPFERAKVRELITFMELHLELVARRLYPFVFFRKDASPRNQGSRWRRGWRRAFARSAALAKFNPYIAGRELTMADCAAFVHLPLISLTTKLAYGRDFLEDMPEVKAYLKTLGERPAFKRVNDDRKAAQAALAKQ